MADTAQPQPSADRAGVGAEAPLTTERAEDASRVAMWEAARYQQAPMWTELTAEQRAMVERRIAMFYEAEVD